MKSKAFTLVELLSVLTIIGVVSLITVPIVSFAIKSSKESLHKDQEKIILAGAIAWASNNTSYLPANDDSSKKSLAITIGFLKANGYLNSNIKNPKTGYLYPNDMIINISYNEDEDKEDVSNIKYNGNYKFEIDESTIETNLELTSDIPSINLNICGTGRDDDYNSSIITDCINNNFDQIYEGYSNISQTQLSFYKNSKEQLSNNELVTYQYKGNNIRSFDMSKYGFYYVYYNKQNLQNIDKDDIRIFMINDMKSPEIKFDNNYKTSYSINSIIDLMDGVECVDNSGYCLIKTLGNIIPSVSGKYVITYIASDNSGNTVREKQVITIK